MKFLKVFWADRCAEPHGERLRCVDKASLRETSEPIARKFLYRSLFLFNVFQILPVAKS